MRASSDRSGHGSGERRAIDAILRRASTDRAFRAALLTDPRAAISAAYGVTIPSDFRLRFVERGPEVDALIVLPDLAPPAADERESLGDVSGGAQGDDGWSRWITD